MIRWEDPPPSEYHGLGAPRKWMPRLEPLMAEPGRWALVAEGLKTRLASKIVWALRSGEHGTLALPPGRWDATSRKQEDGTHRIYAVYLGETTP